MSSEKIVYTTGLGRIQESKPAKPQAAPSDGIVRIWRETKGRKGKGVSRIEGLGLAANELKTLCTELKKTCGTGGAVKEFNIEIQGDNREKIKTLLEKRGYKVKLAGG